MGEKRSGGCDSKNFYVKKSFLDEYKENIAPKLKRIDMLLKTGDFPISASLASKTLDISNDEVFTILHDLNLSKIDKYCFLTVMRHGSSGICKLFKRELDCGSPHLYKPGEIAYIYGLDRMKVEKAYGDLYITEATQKNLFEIFSRIPATRENLS